MHAQRTDLEKKIVGPGRGVEVTGLEVQGSSAEVQPRRKDTGHGWSDFYI